MYAFNTRSIELWLRSFGGDDFEDAVWRSAAVVFNCACAAHMVQCSCHQALGSSLVDQQVSFLLLFLNWSIMSGAILSIAGTIYQGHRRFGDISRWRKCFLMSFSALSCAQSCPVRHLDTADGDCRSFYFHLLIKSTFGLLCLCNKQNNRWLFSDIKFLFSYLF